MAAGKNVRKRKVRVHNVEEEALGELEYDARTDEHGRMIYGDGVFCYEAKKNGTLTLYVDRGDGESVEVVVPKNDVRRLMYAALDALVSEASRR